MSTTTSSFTGPTADPYRSAPWRDLDAELDSLTVPYTGQTRMQLTITSGMADARIRIDPDATELIAIDTGDGDPPRLRVSGWELRVAWSFSFGSWLRAALAGEHRDADIVLHPAVEWSLAIRGGLSEFEADLAAGTVARIDISGGVSDARFELPAPRVAVPIRISGGVSELVLCRPADAGVRVAVAGGLVALGLDEQAFGAIGGDARLSSGLVGAGAPHYDLAISGGAIRLAITSR